MKRNASVMTLMESLITLSNQLLDTGEPFNVCPSYFTKVCRLIDSLVSRNQRESAAFTKYSVWYEQCIKYTTFFISALENSFPQEVILYHLHNAVNVKMTTERNTSLYNLIDDSVFTLSKLLRSDYYRRLVNNMIVALSSMLSHNNVISLNAGCEEIVLKSDDDDEAHSFTVKNRHFRIDPKRIDEFVDWTLSFIFHNVYNPETTLTPINVQRLWLSLLKVASRNTDSTLNLSYRLAYRLLMRNSYEPLFALMLVDLTLCREQEALGAVRSVADSAADGPSMTASADVDMIAWECVRALTMFLANADVNRAFRIRHLRCSPYLSLLRRAVRLIDRYHSLSPARLRWLADFVLNSLPLVGLTLHEASMHDVLNDFVRDLLRFGHHFFDVAFEWRSFAPLSSFFHVLFISRDDEGILDYVRQLLASANARAGTAPMTPEFYNRRWFPCLVCTLFCLSVNEGYSLQIIENLFRIRDASARFSFTELIRERFLGILLEFRRSIVEEDQLNRCRRRNDIIIKSLGVLMNRLDSEFFNRISSKLFVVLKATIVERELCIPTWEIFLRKLSHAQMLVLMPQILVAIVPLLSCVATKTLLNHIFFEREAELINISSEKLFNILLVMSNNDYTKLLDDYIPEKIKEEEAPAILKSCASMLLTEGVETYQMILTRILGFVNDTDIDSKTTSKLNRALLHALRKAHQPEVRDLIARCLGSIGAIDPGKTSLTAAEQTALKIDRVAYVSNRCEFYKLFLERIANWYADCTDSEAVDQLCGCILQNVTEIRGARDGGKAVWDGLDVAARREIEPLKANSLIAVLQPQLQYDCKLPLIQNAHGLQEWMRTLYYYVSNEIIDKTLRKLFLSVLPICDSGSTNFMSEMFPHVLIQALIEKNINLVDDFRKEAICVFRAMLASGGEEWIGLTTQTIFSILDCLERFSFNRLQNLPPTNDSIYKAVCELLGSILGEMPDAAVDTLLNRENFGVPLGVLAAEKCNCFFRAIRWLEQYGIRPAAGTIGPSVAMPLGVVNFAIGTMPTNFKREPFYHLELLCINLDDMDGVLGAYTTIQNNVMPTSTEQILVFEATGNYADALPLCQTIEGEEITLIKCLLRLNQVSLARSHIESSLKRIPTVTNDNSDKDLKYRTALIDLQMEATCLLGEWDQLKEIQQDYFSAGNTSASSGENVSQTALKIDGSDSTGGSTSRAVTETIVNHSWGAQLASIICSLKQLNRRAFDEQLKLTRNSLINSVLSMTMESVESYSQIYKYIIRLHALREIEEVRKIVFNKDKMSIDALVAKWERKSEFTNSINLLEPILAVRRELLRVTNAPGTAEARCRLLLQSARLSRRAGHLQTAWTFLCEARTNNVQSIEIDMETSRYFFQKREKTQAITVLQKSIETHFPDMLAEFSKALRNNKVSDVNRALFDDFTRRKPFVQSYLLLVEFLEQSGANRLDDLLCIYQGLEKCGEDSEAFLYHYAVFFDRYCESMKEVDDDMIFNLLKLYGSVLRQGDKYLQHVMPRMLTVWLDWNPLQFQKPAPLDGPLKRGVGAKKPTRDINAKMRENFNELNHYYFYTCFSQMISRITHSNPAVFKTLKQILSDLIITYPHQCLWRSIAISRSNQSKLQRDRCLEIYELAKKRCTPVNLSLLIEQYTFLAETFIHIAEDANRRGTAKFSDAFPFVAQFFANGTMTRDLSSGAGGRTGAKKGRTSAGRTSIGSATSGSGGAAPQIVLPFIDEVIVQNQKYGYPTAGHFNPTQHPSMIRRSAAGGGDFDALACFSQVELVDTRQQKTLSTDMVYRFREIYIKAVADDFEVLQSMAAPKRMTLIGSDGKRYPLLCKAMDELRKDARFMDVSRMLNSLFKRDAEARRRQLFVRCYGVIPLQETGGIIEWVPDLVTMAGAIRPLVKERAKPIPVPEMQRVSDARLPEEERLRNFRNFLCARTPVVLAEWFRRKFQDASCWYNARLAFTRTAATISIIGFIFGLGDRHAENILIDYTTGEVMHVDFNILFNKGEYLRVPEIVPFRLTRNMVDAFGPTGVEGAFRRSSETVMRVMRNEQGMLVTVLQAFVHDPLMEWTVAESRNQQSRQFGGSALQKTSATECQEAHDTLEMIRLRLAGNIVTARFHKRKDSLEMSVDGQVAKLIEMAIDEGNLSKMYIGWNAFL